MKLLTNSVRFSTPWNAWNMVRVGWSCGPWSWSVSATFFWWSTAAPTSLSTASCAPSSGRRQAKCWRPSHLAKGPICSVFLGKRATEAADCKGFIPIVPTETTLPVFTICPRLRLTRQGLPIPTLGPKTLIMLPPPKSKPWRNICPEKQGICYCFPSFCTVPQAAWSLFFSDKVQIIVTAVTQ